jgi:hypothetical protein
VNKELIVEVSKRGRPKIWKPTFETYFIWGFACGFLSLAGVLALFGMLVFIVWQN